ncbi:hypothetical protein MRB53_023542 [Persea americana]|uniref:Uncharacterized protein n=1 Tax=Persea americana TaxID=3435 RepID=A0ACC2L9R4_PERAE|nr:hypothetical protein MRB53_023542 [Persea americana]
MLLCKSEKLYFRTSLGLLPVSSIDYKAKTLTISHSSCSPSSQFISPSLLSAALPATPQPNSLLLFNCNSRGNEPISSFLRNCSSFYGCRPQEKPFPCLFVNDTEKLEFRFHPKDLSCSHYRRVYGSSSSLSSSSSSSSIEGVEFGTRVSFEVPDRLPHICDECSKPNGNCGIGLRCICHAKECKNKVISGGVRINSYGNLLFSLISIAMMIICFDELVRELIVIEAASHPHYLRKEVVRENWKCHGVWLQ